MRTTLMAAPGLVEQARQTAPSGDSAYASGGQGLSPCTHFLASASDPILAIARTAQARLLLSEAAVCGSPPKQAPAADSGWVSIHNGNHRRSVSIVRRGRLDGAWLFISASSGHDINVSGATAPAEADDA